MRFLAISVRAKLELLHFKRHIQSQEVRILDFGLILGSNKRAREFWPDLHLKNLELVLRRAGRGFAC